MEKDKIYKDLLKNWEAPFDRTEGEAWSRLQDRISSGDRSKVMRMRWQPWALAAASVAVIIAFTFSWNSDMPMRSISTAIAERLDVLLPDGSKASLNAKSNIIFAESWEEEREVQLDGEAFFEVKKGERFAVNTTHGIVEVLGTSFNVFSRNEKFEVRCNTGKVKVTSGSHSSIIEPGERLILSQSGFEKRLFDPGKNSWNAEYSYYENEPMVNVVKELERQFNVTFEIGFEGIENMICNGAFTHENLEMALDQVFSVMNVQWEFKNEMTITLKTRKS